MNKQLDTTEIISQENKLYSAILKSDTEALETLLHDDLLFIIPGGEAVTKEIDLNTYRDGRLAVESLDPQIENINIVDDTAVVVVKMKLQGSYDDSPFSTEYRYIRVWKSFMDGLKVIAGSGSAI